MQELAIFYYLPPVVKLGDERDAVGINILTVQITVDRGKGDVDLNSTYSDILKWGVFGGGGPPINL